VLSLVGGAELVLGYMAWWVDLVTLGSLSLSTWFLWRIRGALPPLEVGMSSLAMSLCITLAC
jgi:hypothetical protein